MLLNCFVRRRAVRSNLGFPLNEAGKIVEQRLNAARTEEYKHVILYFFKVTQVADHSSIKDGASEADFRVLKLPSNVFFQFVCGWKQKTLATMLFDQGHQIAETALTNEDLTLSVDHVFLEVVGNGL